MAYNETLAKRVQKVLENQNLGGFIEKRMFGGVGYLLNGNMACGVHKEYLIVRVGPEGHIDALSQPHTRPFDITGRSMSGWVMVAPEGCEDDATLQEWVTQGVEFASTLPPKP